mgnify:CR=1 FL=1
MKTRTAVQRVFDHHLHRHDGGSVKVGVIVVLAQHIANPEKQLTPKRVAEVLREMGCDVRLDALTLASSVVEGWVLSGAET